MKNIVCPNQSCQYKYVEEKISTGNVVRDLFTIGEPTNYYVTEGDEPFLYIGAKGIHANQYSSTAQLKDKSDIPGVLLACPKCGTVHFHRT